MKSKNVKLNERNLKMQKTITEILKWENSLMKSQNAKIHY